MDLTHLTSQLKLKTDFNANNSLGLNDINGITGIVDNSVSSLQALIFSNKAEFEDIDPTKFDVTGMTSGYDKKCFVFDLKKDYKFTLSSDITDHYVESNVAIQDHIGLKPIILEVSGSIGEITLSSSKGKTSNNIANEIGQDNVSPKNKNIFNAVDSYLGRMGSLTSFAPNIVNQALNVYNSAKYVYGAANKVINLGKKDSTNKSGYDYTEGYDEETINKTKQFYYIDWFKTQWWNRASFTIVTPYGVLTDMYIMDLNAVQPDNTRYVTNLNIKFKQIRRAKIIKRSRKTAQDMETRRYRTGRDNQPPVTVIEDIKREDLIKAPEQTGGVTQVTAQEFEAYSQEIKSFNVAPAQGILPPQGVLMGQMLMGGM